MQPSKASDIPEELFERILWHACGGRRLPEGETRRYVSVLCLVCRYWSRQCRLLLFRRITLRSHDDATRFGDILNAPAVHNEQPTAGMIWYLTAKPDSSDRPWLHLVSFRFLPKLYNLTSFSTVPLHGSTKPLRTLYPSLPRSLPMRHIRGHQLCLHGLHFPTGRVLSRLLSSIPHLQRLQAFGLTFDTKPKPADFTTPPFPRRIALETDSMQLFLAVAPLLFSDVGVRRLAHRRRYPFSVLNEADLKALWDLLSVFDAAPYFRIKGLYMGFSEGMSSWTRCARTASCGPG